MTGEQRPRPSFADLLDRYGDGRGCVAQRVSLSQVLSTGSDPMGIIPYMKSLGIAVSGVADLLSINRVEDEEELSAHEVAEGVAVAVASHGEWVLFLP